MFIDWALLGLLVAALLAAGPGTIRRLCAAVFLAGAFVLVWHAPGEPLARALLAFLAGGIFMLVVKIAFASEKNLSVRGRLSQIFVFPPSLRPARVPATLSLRIAGQIIQDAALVGLALLLLQQSRRFIGVAPGMERLGAGVLLAYAGVQFIFDFARFCFRVMGRSTDALHRAPIAARSVSDFWGWRWNLIVSDWLHTFVFLPLARKRHPRLGILCAFFVSGLLHAWPILVGIGIFGAFTTLLFFTMQGVFVLVENRLRIHAWPVPLARAWTVAVLLATSPLFIEPGLRVFDL